MSTSLRFIPILLRRPIEMRLEAMPEIAKRVESRLESNFRNLQVGLVLQ